MKSEYLIQPMTEKDAKEIASWKYPSPYEIYSFDDDAETVKELLEEKYLSVFKDGTLVGCYCFGTGAQVPTEDTVYTTDALDMGLGMKPALCGMGLGESFLFSGIHYAERNLLQPNQTLRLSVATFNERAIRVYERVGFQKITSIRHAKTGMDFIIMVRRNDSNPKI